jgi:hypothetical protein
MYVYFNSRRRRRDLPYKHTHTHFWEILLALKNNILQLLYTIMEDIFVSNKTETVVHRRSIDLSLLTQFYHLFNTTNLF